MACWYSGHSVGWDNQVGAVDGDGQVIGVVELGITAHGRGHGLRVVDGDGAAGLLEGLCQGEGRTLAVVVGAGLERRAPHDDPGTGDGPVSQSAGDEAQGHVGASLVDLLGGAQEDGGLVGAELPRASGEGPDILGEAAAAVAPRTASFELTDGSQ